MTARRAIALGGTCIDEHGVGPHKTGYRQEEASKDAVLTMRRIKQAPGPAVIMNPRKVLGRR